MSSPTPLVDPIPIEPPASPPLASVRVPGSKSITNRALLCAGLAEGTSTLRGVGSGDDIEAMTSCLLALGVSISIDNHIASVTGVGRSLSQPNRIWANQSGTTARFLAPVLAFGDSPTVLDGADQLRGRPMDHLFAALEQGGIQVRFEGAPGHLPCSFSRTAATTISTTSAASVIRVEGSASSQFLSGLLLAAPLSATPLEVAVEGALVSRPYVDLTCSVMNGFGVVVEEPTRNTFRVPTTAEYVSADFDVEPDASAATYFAAAAALTGGTITIQRLHRNALQGDIRFLDVVESMGAIVRDDPAGVTIIGSGHLRGIEIDMADISDTVMTLAALAPFADTPTRISGIGFIRRKESDRIGNLVRELTRAGIDAIEDSDGLTIFPGEPQPTTFETYDDHRMAMALSLIGLRSHGIAVAGPACVAKTFPDYFEVLDSIRDSRAHP